MIILGVMTGIVGLQADIISGNRKLLEDIQYHVRKLDYDKCDEKNSNCKEESCTVLRDDVKERA